MASHCYMETSAYRICSFRKKYCFYLAETYIGLVISCTYLKSHSTGCFWECIESRTLIDVERTTGGQTALVQKCFNSF